MRRSNTEKKFVTVDCTANSTVNSLNNIYKRVNQEGLSDDAAAELADDIKFITERFGICTKAAVLLSAIMEKTNSSSSCDEEDLACFIGCTNLEFFGFHDALRELEDRNIIRKSNGRGVNYKATVESMKAVERETEFVPKMSVGLDTEELFTRFRLLVSDLRNDNIEAERFHEDVVDLIDKNQQLLFCRKVSESPLWSRECNDTERRIFFYLCHRYVSFCNPSVAVDTLMNLTEFMEDEQRLRRHIANSDTGLQKTGLVNFGNENGFVDNEKLALSDEVKATFFSEIELAPEEKVEHKDLIHWETIKEQKLFYNEKEGAAVERLLGILEEENFKAVQKRLTEQNMPCGVSVVMFGAPGSGKTASLKEIARRTKRDLFWVDLSAIKSKWVGESEKQVKALFETYRNLARTADRAPILAVNEADAIFTQRITNVEQSVDQMNNAITDIILNELENLNGILVATTNLVGNIMGKRDNAMERRFLYKVEFNAPGEEVRAKIWKSKLADLSDGDAATLARMFTFSGGNIENIARKCTVEYVLSGVRPDLDAIIGYCKEENIAQTSAPAAKKIGFSA